MMERYNLEMEYIVSDLLKILISFCLYVSITKAQTKYIKIIKTL